MPTVRHDARTIARLLHVRLVLAVALIALPAVVDVAASQIPWIVLLAVHLLVWSYALRAGPAVMETSETDLDEREVQIRNGASWWGLTTLCSLVVLLAVLLIVGSGRDAGFFVALRDRSGYFLIGMVLTSLSVPSVLAQTALVRPATDDPLFVDDPELDDTEFDDTEFDDQEDPNRGGPTRGNRSA